PGDLLARAAQEQVIWLYVAVVNLLGVRRGEPRGSLADQVERGARRHRPGALQILAHRLSAQQLHDEIGRGGVFRGHVADVYDVGMVDAARALRFTEEPQAVPRIVLLVRGEYLQRTPLADDLVD